MVIWRIGCVTCVTVRTFHMHSLTREQKYVEKKQNWSDVNNEHSPGHECPMC